MLVNLDEILGHNKTKNENVSCIQVVLDIVCKHKFMSKELFGSNS
jgi:hypothetical protein